MRNFRPAALTLDASPRGGIPRDVGSLLSARCRLFPDTGCRNAAERVAWNRPWGALVAQAAQDRSRAWTPIHLVGGKVTMERVSLARGLTWKRRPVYHRMTASGELVRVEAIERKGRHYRLTLENGHTFLVDRDHVLYTLPKQERLRLG
jgi:hypothetical protein